MLSGCKVSEDPSLIALAKQVALLEKLKGDISVLLSADYGGGTKRNPPAPEILRDRHQIARLVRPITSFVPRMSRRPSCRLAQNS